jgi:hypothetical protein
MLVRAVTGEELLGVHTQDHLANLVFDGLGQVCQAVGSTESEQRSASKGLVEVATSILGPSDRYLMVAKVQAAELQQAVYYDPVAATGFIAGLIGGIIGAANPVVVGCAVVGCLASLKGLRKAISRAEGILFWTVYERPHHVVPRKQAEGRFKELCESEDGVQPADFSAALQGLLDLGCIEESEGNLSVAGVVIVY